MKSSAWLVCALAWAGLIMTAGFAGAQMNGIPVNALWVDGSGVGLRSQESISELMSTATSTGFNTIIAAVRSEGDSHAMSTLEPRAENIAPHLLSPLSALLGVASTHEPPLQVWAGVNVLSVHRGATLPPSGHVIQKYPAWVMQDRIGGRDAREEGVIHHFLDPGITGAREYTVDVIVELVNNSAFDALVLNDLRYPEGGSEWGYSALALREFQHDVGDVGIPSSDDPVWVRWRQDRVTQLLTEICTAVRAVRPDLPIYVCVETAGSISGGFESSATFNELFQDWPRWIRADLCDGVIVKLFRDGRRDDSSQELNDWLRFAREFEDETEMICGFSGQMNYRNYLFRQMRMANSLGGNLVLFGYDNPARDSDAGFWDDLRIAVIRSQRMLMPDAGEGQPQMSDSAEQPADEFTSSNSTPNSSTAETFFATDSPSAPDSEMAPTTASEAASPPPTNGLDLSDQLPPPTSLTELEEAPMSEESESEPGVFEDIPTVSNPRPYTSLIAPSGSDTVTTNSGRVIVGEIIDESASEIVIELESGNSVQIPHSQISSIERGRQ